MTERWHRTSELAGLPGMPRVARAIRNHGPRRGWISRPAPGHAQALEWLEVSLPAKTQSALRGHAAGDGAAAPVVAATKLDARTEIVTAFDAWRPSDVALVPALKAWCAMYKATGAGVSAEARAAVPACAWNTLQRWRNTLRAEGRVADRRGGRQSDIDADAALAAYLEAHLRANPRHVTAKHLQRAVMAEFGQVLSISQVRRWVRAWRRDNSYAMSAGTPDAHRSHTMPAFGSESDGVERLNQIWELDSTRADVMCADGRRHALVAGIDIWSRRGRVLVTPQSNAAAVSALVRRCLLDWGVPETVRTDEGADYTSVHLRRVLADLGVEHDVLPPYSPDKKAFIERFIGTLSRDLLSQLPGFTGHNVAQAQALRERRSFADRRGEDRTVTFRAELTAEELQDRLDAWCRDLYEREPHTGLGGLTPFARAAGSPSRPVDERALDMLLAPAAGTDGRRKVSKKGISVDGGLYIHGALGGHSDDWVHVRQDPTDYGRIVVYTAPDADGMSTFICVAEDPSRTGVDRQAVAAQARANWRARNRSERERTRELERQHLPSHAIDKVLANAGREAGKVVALPVRGPEHRTGALDAAADAADAVEAADTPGTAGAEQSIFERFYQEQ